MQFTHEERDEASDQAENKKVNDGEGNQMFAIHTWRILPVHTEYPQGKTVKKDLHAR